MPRALLNVPKQARKGEVIQIKALMQHPMETGYRRDASGTVVPRDIIHLVVCTYNGEEVFRAELFPAIAANPFLTFFTVATDSGTIALHWTDDHGQTESQSAEISVA